VTNWDARVRLPAAAASSVSVISSSEALLRGRRDGRFVVSSSGGGPADGAARLVEHFDVVERFGRRSPGRRSGTAGSGRAYPSSESGTSPSRRTTDTTAV